MTTVDTPRLSDGEAADALIYAGQKILPGEGGGGWGGGTVHCFFFLDYAENLKKASNEATVSHRRR